MNRLNVVVRTNDISGRAMGMCVFLNGKRGSKSPVVTTRRVIQVKARTHDTIDSGRRKGFIHVGRSVGMGYTNRLAARTPGLSMGKVERVSLLRLLA